ncbi:uncharacterized protein LOC121387859 [Gigantopelta aegis]|uniref:uncharacterized protein LOC121387859 n=1 Tax=Gigantopelta aegis TaxID=1735272 RepID=UPI001B88A070|nr:uncharacterized protein LOC121387859 [Gigantopelta aegis]
MEKSTVNSCKSQQNHKHQYRQYNEYLKRLAKKRDDFVDQGKPDLAHALERLRLSSISNAQNIYRLLLQHSRLVRQPKRVAASDSESHRQNGGPSGEPAKPAPGPIRRGKRVDPSKGQPPSKPGRNRQASRADPPKGQPPSKPSLNVQGLRGDPPKEPSDQTSGEGTDSGQTAINESVKINLRRFRTPISVCRMRSERMKEERAAKKRRNLAVNSRHRQSTGSIAPVGGLLKILSVSHSASSIPCNQRVREQRKCESLQISKTTRVYSRLASDCKNGYTQKSIANAQKYVAVRRGAAGESNAIRPGSHPCCLDGLFVGNASPQSASCKGRSESKSAKLGSLSLDSLPPGDTAGENYSRKRESGYTGKAGTRAASSKETGSKLGILATSKKLNTRSAGKLSQRYISISESKAPRPKSLKDFSSAGSIVPAKCSPDETGFLQYDSLLSSEGKYLPHHSLSDQTESELDLELASPKLDSLSGGSFFPQSSCASDFKTTGASPRRNRVRFNSYSLDDVFSSRSSLKNTLTASDSKQEIHSPSSDSQLMADSFTLQRMSVGSRLDERKVKQLYSFYDEYSADSSTGMEDSTLPYIGNEPILNEVDNLPICDVSYSWMTSSSESSTSDDEQELLKFPLI